MTILYARTLKYALERYQGNALLSYLPEEVRAKVEAAPLISSFVMPSKEKELQAVHFSWLLPFLQTLSPAMQRLSIAVLTPQVQKKLSSQLPIAPLTLHPLLYSFMLEWLYEKFFPTDYIPSSLLESQELTILFQLSREQLLEVVDLLGIQDLALVLRQSINKKILEKVQELLTPMQQRYLAYCLHMPLLTINPSIAPELLITSREESKRWVHQWGLVRLAIALTAQEPALLHTLVYRFDQGRAKVLLDAVHSTANLPQRSVMQLALSVKQATSLIGVKNRAGVT